MGEDLDQTVERFAFLVSSEVVNEHGTGMRLLHASILGARADAAAEGFARLAQELAVFMGGAFLRQILREGLDLAGKSPGQAGFHLSFRSIDALSVFTSSKVFVEGCLRERGAQEVFGRLYRQLMQALLSARARCFPKSGRHEGPSISTLIASLDCLANFARASKAFRDVIREQQNVFQLFQDLLQPTFLSAMAADFSHKIRLYLACLAVSLAYAADSQIWAINGGLLKLLAAIYEQSPLGEFSKLPQRCNSPAYCCNQVLFRLLTSEPTTEKLRAHNALEGFRP